MKNQFQEIRKKYENKTIDQIKYEANIFGIQFPNQRASKAELLDYFLDRIKDIDTSYPYRPMNLPDFRFQSEQQLKNPQNLHLFFQRRRGRIPCPLSEYDIEALQFYLDSSITLTPENLPDVQSSFIYLLIPTFITDDENRIAALKRNIDVYKNAFSEKLQVIFFIHSKYRMDWTDYFNQYLISVDTSIFNIFYSYPEEIEHVGFARKAMAFFLIKYLYSYVPDAKVIISDDRRWPEKVFAKDDTKILLINMVCEESNYPRLISPIGERKGSNRDNIKRFKKNLIPNFDILAQIYIGEVKTFIDIYACIYKNAREQCPVSLDERPRYFTPILEACFQPIFEDSSFVTGAYDNGFELLSYIKLKRMTNKGVVTKARQGKERPGEQRIRRKFQKQAAVARDSCVMYSKDKILCRWGGKIYEIDKKDYKSFGAHLDLIQTEF